MAFRKPPPHPLSMAVTEIGGLNLFSHFIDDGYLIKRDMLDLAPQKYDHNNTWIKLVTKGVVELVSSRCTKGSLFDKKNIRQLQASLFKTETVEFHTWANEGSDVTEPTLKYLYESVCRRFILSAMYRAVAPYCEKAHHRSCPPPGCRIFSDACSPADIWVLDKLSVAALYPQSRNQKACIDLFLRLSIYFHELKCKGVIEDGEFDEAKLKKCVEDHVNGARKKELHKLYQEFQHKYKFSVEPKTEAFGICWRAPLKRWTASKEQRDQMLRDCSTFNGYSQEDVVDVGRCIQNSLLQVGSANWGGLLDEMFDHRKLLLGKLYFAKYMSCPTRSDESDVFVISERDVELANSASAQLKDLEQIEYTMDTCVSLCDSAYMIHDILKENFGRRIPRIKDKSEISHIASNWKTPETLRTQKRLRGMKGVIKTLLNPPPGAFPGTRLNKIAGNRKAYVDMIKRLKRGLKKHPSTACAIYAFGQILSTVGRLDAWNLNIGNHVSEKPFGSREMAKLEKMYEKASGVKKSKKKQLPQTRPCNLVITADGKIKYGF